LDRQSCAARRSSLSRLRVWAKPPIGFCADQDVSDSGSAFEHMKANKHLGKIVVTL
jgi:hypothetical protein